LLADAGHERVDERVIPVIWLQMRPHLKVPIAPDFGMRVRKRGKIVAYDEKMYGSTRDGFVTRDGFAVLQPDLYQIEFVVADARQARSDVLADVMQRKRSRLFPYCCMR
jgi:hypothetical protein